LKHHLLFDISILDTAYLSWLRVASINVPNALTGSLRICTLNNAQHCQNWPSSPTARSAVARLHERNRSSHVRLIDIGDVGGRVRRQKRFTVEMRREMNPITWQPLRLYVVLNTFRREYWITDQL